MFDACSHFCKLNSLETMDRSTLEKLILAKLPLPEDCRKAIKSFIPLNPPTPTAALISQLDFYRRDDWKEGGPALDVGGPGVRISGEYGRLRSS